MVDLNWIVLPKPKNVNTYIMHLMSHCSADFLENMRSKGSLLVHLYLDYLHIFLHNITFRKFILHRHDQTMISNWSGLKIINEKVVP